MSIFKENFVTGIIYNFNATFALLKMADNLTIKENQ